MKWKVIGRLVLGSQKCLGGTTLNNGPNQNMHVVVTKRQDEQPVSRCPELKTHRLLSVSQGSELLEWTLYQVRCSS